ncbi:MAG: crosslink repair DNA glycosylase YcaQ family protein [Pseudomonadota bacterium]
MALSHAMGHLCFVQADPIRAPAAAQDLILRHRVSSYTNGDLVRDYPSLDLEEDVFYAYGFMPRETWQLIRPLADTELSDLEQLVLTSVCESGPTHPRDLIEVFGRKRVRNDWGGYSLATKRTLEILHRRGLLRVARRENGVRLYEAAMPPARKRCPQERFLELIMVLAKIFAPVRRKSLQARIAPLRRRVLGQSKSRGEIDELLRAGRLESQVVDETTYLWPESRHPLDEVQPTVRFLAPFDPVVWDRERFKHLWGWTYRFEAYKPKSERIRGYYAMPMLFNDDIIGWAEVKSNDSGMDVKLGFIRKRPKSRSFKSALDAELARMESFLQIKAA